MGNGLGDEIMLLDGLGDAGAAPVSPSVQIAAVRNSITEQIMQAQRRGILGVPLVTNLRQQMRTVDLYVDAMTAHDQTSALAFWQQFQRLLAEAKVLRGEPVALPGGGLFGLSTAANLANAGLAGNWFTDWIKDTAQEAGIAVANKLQCDTINALGGKCNPSTGVVTAMPAQGIPGYTPQPAPVYPSTPPAVYPQEEPPTDWTPWIIGGVGLAAAGVVVALVVRGRK